MTLGNLSQGQVFPALIIECAFRAAIGYIDQVIDAPSQPTRLMAVDALRGLALAGMLVVHFQYYADGPETWAPRVQALVDLLFTERFYALFAFLFGVGFALQATPARDRHGFVRMYTRRLLALAVFALLILGLTGYRVLLDYAFWGFGLLLIRRWPARALLATAAAVMLLGPTLHAVRWQVEKRTVGVDASNAAVRRELARWPDYRRQESDLASRGDFAGVVSHRIGFALSGLVRWQRFVPGPDALMFLLGMLAVRTGILREPARHRRLLTGVTAGGLVLGIGGGLMPAAWWSGLAGESLRLRMAGSALQWTVFNPMFQGLAYGAALLLWISRSPIFPTWSAHLGRAGRMSLTNYVVQVTALEVLFTALGLRISRPFALAAAGLFFAAQIGYSGWWLDYFRMGPLEWVWRSVTYWRMEPLKHPPQARAVIES